MRPKQEKRLLVVQLVTQCVSDTVMTWRTTWNVWSVICTKKKKKKWSKASREGWNSLSVKCIICLTRSGRWMKSKIMEMSCGHFIKLQPEHKVRQGAEFFSASYGYMNTVTSCFNLPRISLSKIKAKSSLSLLQSWNLPVLPTPAAPGFLK